MARYSDSGDIPPVRLAWSADRSPLGNRHFDTPHGPDGPTADELFAAIDGRSLAVLDYTWRVKVYCIYDHDDSRWLQVRLDGRPPHSTTLRVAVDASPDDVLQALTTWALDESAPAVTTRGGAYIH